LILECRAAAQGPVQSCRWIQRYRVANARFLPHCQPFCFHEA
jgi:hypothetical protein